MKIFLARLRAVVQIACLSAFLWLFLQTEYRGQDQLAYPVSLLFRIDPLAALADALAPGPFGWALLWPALAVLALTLVFGRFFCGWICPLGTTLDGAGKCFARPQNRLAASWRRIKYYLLLALSVAALCGIQLIGLFDPLAIFLRSLTLSVYPAWNLALNALFDFFYRHRVPLVSDLLDGAYPFFRDHLMAFHQPFYLLGLLTLVVFAGIVLLERFERRFWCRNLCPLGGLLGLCSRWSRLKRQPDEPCADCRLCPGSCRMGALDEAGHHPDRCVLCFECTGLCAAEKVSFSWHGRASAGGGIDLQRRGVVASLAGGALVGPVALAAPPRYRLEPSLLRPPGALAEEEFLRRCIRCGECMKVCIGQALHPALLQAGAAGLWTPLLVARLGYCEYNCTLCGQVCPTGAIRPLSLEQKQKEVVGLAVIDRNRCLPFVRGEECLVCEEHCPTGQKAIVFEEKPSAHRAGAVVKFPRVVAERCVGCGICETRCPVEGRSAVVILNERESRRPQPQWSESYGSHHPPEGVSRC